MKRLKTIFLGLAVSAGVVSCQQTPTEAPQKVIDYTYVNGKLTVVNGSARDTLEICCSTIDFDKNHIMRCLTANGDCALCYEICEGWRGTGLEPQHP